MPTIQGTDSFNHAISAPPYSAVFGTPTSVGTPLYPSQSASLLIEADGTNQGVRYDLTATPSRPWLGFAFRCDSYPPGVLGANLCALHPLTAPNNEMRIDYSGNGAGGGRLNGSFTSGVVMNGASYTAGTWVWIEAIANFTGTTYNGFWQVSEANQPSPTLAGQTVDTADYTQLISYTADETIDLYFAYWHWGSAASDSDFLGEPAGVTLADNPPLARLGRGAGW